LFRVQWALGRSSVEVSPVLALKICNVAPPTVGSSPLPGVGRVKPPRTTKVRCWCVEEARRVSRVPGTG